MEDDTDNSDPGYFSPDVVVMDPFVVSGGSGGSGDDDTTGSDDWFNDFRNSDYGNSYFDDADSSGDGSNFFADLFNFAGSAVRNLAGQTAGNRPSSGGSSGGSSSGGQRPTTTTTTNTSQTINNFVNSPVGLVVVIFAGLILYKNLTK